MKNLTKNIVLTRLQNNKEEMMQNFDIASLGLFGSYATGNHTEGFKDSESFWLANNQMNFNACNNLLLAVSEESLKIDSDLKGKYAKIPWEKLKGLRNRLAHDYRGLNPNITYTIISLYLADLKNAMIDMLQYNRI